MSTRVVFFDFFSFFFHDPATTEIYTLSLHDALPILFSFGAGSSSSAMAAYSLVSVNGLTTTEATKHKTTSKIISQLTTTGSVLEEASLESFESSGFTLDWTSTNAAERILNHIAIGGGSLKCSVTQQQQNGTNAAQSFAHGLGANPTAVMFFSGLSSTAPPETTTTIKNSIGCWAGGEQFSVGQYAIDGVGTTNCRRALSVNSVMQEISTTFRRTMAVSTVDSTNVNCTYPVTTTSADRRFTMVAISGCKSQVGTFDCNGSTDDLAISCSGITPKLFIPFLVPQGVDSSQTVLQDMGLTIGGYDGSNNVSCGFNDEHGVTTSNSNRHQSSSTIVEHLKTGTKAFEATVSFDGQTVVIDPTTNTTSDRGQGGYLIIG